jgi:hypothetical protein
MDYTPSISVVAGSKTVGGQISAPIKVSDERFFSDKHVGEYIYVKTLGKGTFGKVRLAEHRQSKKLVCPSASHNICIDINELRHFPLDSVLILRLGGC